MCQVLCNAGKGQRTRGRALSSDADLLDPQQMRNSSVSQQLWRKLPEGQDREKLRSGLLEEGTFEPRREGGRQADNKQNAEQRQKQCKGPVMGTASMKICMAKVGSVIRALALLSPSPRLVGQATPAVLLGRLGATGIRNFHLCSLFLCLG